MGRPPCSDQKEVGLKKGAWTAEEDQKLVAFMEKNKGHGSWRSLPQLAGLQRCGKSCRLRWTNYLRPNIKRGNFSPDEERMITQLHALLGNKWSSIASHLPGRTDNEVKNHWNTHMKKRLTRMGIDPATHRSLHNIQLDPRSPLIQHTAGISSFNGNLLSNHRGTALPKPAQRRVALSTDQSFISHMAQWELARLEAEARLAPRPADQSIISLIKPSASAIPSSTTSSAWRSSSSLSSSALACNRFIKSPPHNGDPMTILQAVPELHTLVLCDDHENSSISHELPSFDTSSSTASDHQCAASAMSNPKLYGEESYDQMDEDEWAINSSCRSNVSSRGGGADAETASSDHSRGTTSTTLLLPEELDDLTMSTHDDEVTEPPLFDDLIPPLSDHHEPCDSGPAYWAHLLHGLFQGSSTCSLSSC